MIDCFKKVQLLTAGELFCLQGMQRFYCKRNL